MDHPVYVYLFEKWLTCVFYLSIHDKYLLVSYVTFTSWFPVMRIIKPMNRQTWLPWNHISMLSQIWPQMTTRKGDHPVGKRPQPPLKRPFTAKQAAQCEVQRFSQSNQLRPSITQRDHWLGLHLTGTSTWGETAGYLDLYREFSAHSCKKCKHLIHHKHIHSMMTSVGLLHILQAADLFSQQI